MAVSNKYRVILTESQEGTEGKFYAVFELYENENNKLCAYRQITDFKMCLDEEDFKMQLKEALTECMENEVVTMATLDENLGYHDS